MEKDFNSWNILKQELDFRTNFPTFKQREIWWCHLGLNIGDEENGKGAKYARPILIFKKFNNHLFWGLPLTTKIKEKHYYHKILFKGKEQSIMLSQFRILEVRRLTTKLGRISQGQMKKLKEIMGDMIFN